MQRLTVTHVTRWQRHKRQVGHGHVYQGRFKSYPVSSDEYFYQVVRYVERNALRARLCKRAEHWRWSSLWRRQSGTAEQHKLVSEWPLPAPSRWASLVNEVQTEAEIQALRKCVNRGQPFGPESWIDQCVRKLDLESTIRPRGRPRSAK